MGTRRLLMKLWNTPHALSVLVVTVLLSGLSIGLVAASGLGTLSSRSLGAADAPVTSCSTQAVSMVYDYQYMPSSGHYEVTAVEVTGLASACAGEHMSVTLSGTAYQVSALTTIPPVYNGVTPLVVNVQADPNQVTSAHLAVYN